jgi:hypothetical protein
MRSSRGSTARGSSSPTSSSLRRPAGSSTSTHAAGKVNCCIPATTSSAATRSPRSNRAAASDATLAAAARVMRGQHVEHEYELPRRLGRAARQAIRSLATKDGIVLFDALVEQFMRTEPYSKAQRVFVIVDNGSAHRGQRSINRLQGRYKNLILVRGSVGVVRPPDSSTSASAPSTPAGSTKPRSTSPSPNARSTPPTTSPTSTRSNSNCWRSVAATSRSPPRSNGSSPEPTSTASPTASTYPPPTRPDPSMRRRTSEPEHAVGRPSGPRPLLPRESERRQLGRSFLEDSARSTSRAPRVRVGAGARPSIG